MASMGEMLQYAQAIQGIKANNQSINPAANAVGALSGGISSGLKTRQENKPSALDAMKIQEIAAKIEQDKRQEQMNINMMRAAGILPPSQEDNDAIDSQAFQSIGMRPKLGQDGKPIPETVTKGSKMADIFDTSFIIKDGKASTTFTMKDQAKVKKEAEAARRLKIKDENDLLTAKNKAIDRKVDLHQEAAKTREKILEKATALAKSKLPPGPINFMTNAPTKQEPTEDQVFAEIEDIKRRYFNGFKDRPELGKLVNEAFEQDMAPLRTKLQAANAAKLAEQNAANDPLGIFYK